MPCPAASAPSWRAPTSSESHSWARAWRGPSPSPLRPLELSADSPRVPTHVPQPSVGAVPAAQEPQQGGHQLPRGWDSDGSIDHTWSWGCHSPRSRAGAVSVRGLAAACGPETRAACLWRLGAGRGTEAWAGGGREVGVWGPGLARLTSAFSCLARGRQPGSWVSPA